MLKEKDTIMLSNLFLECKGLCGIISRSPLTKSKLTLLNPVL